MTANFDRGVLTASTWHKLNEIGALNDAAHMIDAAAMEASDPAVWRRALDRIAQRVAERKA